MKKNILLALLVLSVSFTYAQKRVTGNGVLKTIHRNVGNFDGVYASGSFDIKLVDGKEGSITIKAEENLLQYIESEVENGSLKLKWRKGMNISTRKGVNITVPVDKIEKLKLSGSGEIISSKKLKANDFEIAVSGSGEIEVPLDVASVEVSVSGSGEIELTGKADYLEAAISGSGDVEADDLVVKKASLKISGSGGIDLYVTDELHARVSGSGDIRYKGDPRIEDIKVSGSGDVEKM